MSSKQKQTANEQPKTLWSLFDEEDDAKKCRECGTTNCSRRPGVPYCSLPVKPYNGSSGWSGTDTSKERADNDDSSGRTKDRQQKTMKLLYHAGVSGLTWKELAYIAEWHHGTASGALSVLHKDERIARLTEKRMNCRVYVLPEFVIGRETDKQGRKHECPECGHRF